MTKIYNKAKETYKRKQLRRSLTEHERIFCSAIKDNKLDGLKFVRQYSVEGFVIDFYCRSKKLGIEIDGEHHKNENRNYDEQRDYIINSYGITLLRFSNIRIKNELSKVMTEIENFLPLSREGGSSE